MTEVRLDGLRWSATTTRWPSDAWRARALRDSIQIGPDVFEIRGGTAEVSDDVLAP